MRSFYFNFFLVGNSGQAISGGCFCGFRYLVRSPLGRGSSGSVADWHLLIGTGKIGCLRVGVLAVIVGDGGLDGVLR